MQRSCGPLAILQGKEKYTVLWLHTPGKVPTTAAINLWNAAEYRVCVDGGANDLEALTKKGVCRAPHLISGDFDSITSGARSFFTSKDVKFIETPDQDYTDMCKALYIIADKIKLGEINVIAVVILGGLSGRFDHTLSTIHSLLRFLSLCQLPTFVFDGTNLAAVLDEGTSVLHWDNDKLYTGKCGIIPFVQRETIATTTGLKWNLKDTRLAFGELISTSNEITSGSVTVTTTAPVIFTMELSNEAVS